MSDMRHMHADLMRTSCFETQPQTRVHTEVFHDAIVSDRWFAHRMHRHMGAFGGMAADWLVHRATRSHMTNRYGFVLTGNFTPLQRLHQTRLSWNRFATTIKPVVSLSRRWTMPARGTSAIGG